MIGRSSSKRRKDPNLTQAEITQVPAPTAAAAGPPVDLAWVTAAVAELRAVRAGRSSTWEANGVLLLERVTRDEKTGATYYLLTNRAHELLRAGGGLPWGRD